jgi:hypothetical protein
MPSERARSVAGAERQDAERQPGLDQGRGGGVQGAVAAADDHAVEGAGPGADGVGDRVLLWVVMLLDGDPACRQDGQGGVDRLPCGHAG